MPPRQWVPIVFVGLGASVVPLDTAVNIGFPDITKSFGLPIHMIQWVVISYVLTYASLMLAFGRAGDIFGHARVFRAGLAWSAIAFLLCAAAPAYGWLLFCRFLQGIGAGLIISVAPALVTGMFPESRRGRAVAAFTMMFALASAAGPLIGGALVNVWGWPAVFWFRVPIALVPLALFAGYPDEIARPRWEALDLVGAVLLALTISSLLLLVNEAPQLGRQNWSALPLLTLAALGTYAFIRREARFSTPIVDLGLFRNPSFAAINLASVFVYLTSFSVLLFVPYYLVRVVGLPLPSAGAFLAASFGGTIAASPLAERLIRHQRANRIVLAGAAICGAGLIALGSLNDGAHLSAPTVLSVLFVQGFGVGLFQVAYMDAIVGAMPRRDRGVAGSIAMLTRTLGIVIGATMLTLLFDVFEASALTAGQTPPVAFLAAFRSTLYVAGSVSILGGLAALGLVKPRGR